MPYKVTARGTAIYKMGSNGYPQSMDISYTRVAKEEYPPEHVLRGWLQSAFNDPDRGYAGTLLEIRNISCTSYYTSRDY